MEKEVLHITIFGWERFNPRNDRKNYCWFRFQNSFFTDQNTFDLDAKEQQILIFCLCEASKNNEPVVVLRLEYISRMLKRNPREILANFKSLQLRGLLTYQEPRYERTNETNENVLQNDLGAENHKPRLNFDFESLYKKYPLKRGKTQGIARCKTQIKTQEDYDKLSEAIDRYALYCIQRPVEPQFIKQFSTFMSSWADWLDSDVGRVTLNRNESIATPEKLAALEAINQNAKKRLEEALEKSRIAAQAGFKNE